MKLKGITRPNIESDCGLKYSLTKNHSGLSHYYIFHQSETFITKVSTSKFQ